MTAPRAYWEPLPDCSHGIVRLYKDGSTPYGEPYDLAFTVVDITVPGITRRVADIRGLATDAGITVADQRAIFDCLGEQGFDRVQWDRFKVRPDGAIARRVVSCRLH